MSAMSMPPSSGDFLRKLARDSKTRAAVLLALAEDNERDADRYTSLAAQMDVADADQMNALVDQMAGVVKQSTDRTRRLTAILEITNAASSPPRLPP